MVFVGNAINYMALIILVVAAIKMIVILVSPKAWLNIVVKKVWAKPILTMIITLILAGVSLYYLIGAGITIAEIFAVMLFMSLLAAVGVAVYAKEMLGSANKLLANRNILKKSWLYIIIWIALIVWGFYALFS